MIIFQIFFEQGFSCIEVIVWHQRIPFFFSRWISLQLQNSIVIVLFLEVFVLTLSWSKKIIIFFNNLRFKKIAYEYLQKNLNLINCGGFSLIENNRILLNKYKKHIWGELIKRRNLGYSCKKTNYRRHHNNNIKFHTATDSDYLINLKSLETSPTLENSMQNAYI